MKYLFAACLHSARVSVAGTLRRAVRWRRRRAESWSITPRTLDRTVGGTRAGRTTLTQQTAFGEPLLFPGCGRQLSPQLTWQHLRLRFANEFMTPGSKKEAGPCKVYIDRATSKTTDLTSVFFAAPPRHLFQPGYAA